MSVIITICNNLLKTYVYVSVTFAIKFKGCIYYRSRSEASKGYVFTGICLSIRVLYSGKQTDATAIKPVAYWLGINDVIWAGRMDPLLECILVNGIIESSSNRIMLWILSSIKVICFVLNSEVEWFM